MSDYSPQQPSHDENGVPLCKAYGCPLAASSGHGDFKLCGFHSETQPRYWAEITTRIKKYKRVLELLHDVNVNPVKWASRRIEYLDDSTYRQKEGETQGQWLIRVRRMVRGRILDGLDRKARTDNENGFKMATDYLQGGCTSTTVTAPPDYQRQKEGE